MRQFRHLETRLDLGVSSAGVPMLIDPPVVPTLTIWRVRACAPTASCVSLAVCATPACLAELRRTASNRAAGVWIHQSRTRKHVHTRRWGGRAAGRPAGSVPPARFHSLTPRVQVESEDWIGAGEAVSLRQAVHLRHAVLNQYLEATLDGAVRPLPTFDTRARTRPLDPPCPSFCLL
jgi:hypothetical protein